MKNKIFKIVCTVLFVILFSACNNDEGTINPSVSFIKVESEGGEFEITFNNDNFFIAGVMNTAENNSAALYGEVYSIDGKLLRENERLYLEGLGYLESFWNDRGVRIVRDSPFHIKLIIDENVRKEEFCFALVLQSGEEQKKILVNQKMSQGYTFDCIEYSLQENDSDFLYMKLAATYSFNISASQEISISPFLNAGSDKLSYFISNDKGAFFWTVESEVEVDIPSGINNNTIYFNKIDKSIYSEQVYSRSGEYADILVKVDVPAGKSEFYVKVEYCKRTVSYAMTLINNRTKDKKIINGKWVEIAQTGNHSVIWK